jgi:hypothetical protein
MHTAGDGLRIDTLHLDGHALLAPIDFGQAAS